MHDGIRTVFKYSFDPHAVTLPLKLKKGKCMGYAIFKVPTPLMLSKVVDKLDDIFITMAEAQDADVRGDVYEYLLNKISQSGINGQFRTPRHIIRMMVDMVEPKPGDTICENCTTSLIRIAAA